ncbi:MAG: hypothetical protein AAF614_33610 [Chloroflexota bacterium]
MNILRRLIGLILLLGGLLGIALSVAGVIYGRQAVDLLGNNVSNTLILAGNSLGTVEDTLLLAKASIADVNVSMVTVQKTANDVAKTLGDTRPLIQTANTLATNDVPMSIEAVQDAVPNIVEVAGVVDDTLITLSEFSLNQSFAVPNPLNPRATLIEIPLNFGLGVEYEPTVPFDAAVEQVGGSLEGLPDRLRTLEKDLIVADANLAVISADIYNVSLDLATINGRIAEISPLLDEYIRIINEIKDTLNNVREQINAQLETAKLVVLVIMIWIGLGNLAPLYLGIELLGGRRAGNNDEEVEEELAEMKAELSEMKEDVAEIQEESGE